MRKLYAPLLAGVFAVGLIAGAGVAQAAKPSIVLVTNAAADFWTIARRGVEKAQAENPDYDMSVVVTGQATAAEQRRELDDLLARGVAGISISVDDAPHATEELNKVAEKAVLITTDSDAPQSKRLAYIGTDNVAAGRQAGEEIKKALPDGGKIMLFVGTLDADNARERVQGIREVLQGSKVEIIDVRTDQVDFAKAKANAEDTLTKYPDIALMSGLWSYDTPQVVAAVKAAGKCGKVKIVGFDEDPVTLRGIADGCIQSTIVQNPFEFGYQSMINIVKTTKGDKSWVPADGKIIIPTRVIDQSNVQEFAQHMKELLRK
jgi:ribose transport system substrate-binding protein